MTPWVFLAIAAAGGLGAATRFVVDGAIRSAGARRLPWGTMLINITGSFALGLIVGLAASHLVSHEWSLIIGTGFLGGYTTFSTASFETVRLLQERHAALALVTSMGQLFAATLAAGAGLLLGALL